MPNLALALLLVLLPCSVSVKEHVASTDNAGLKPDRPNAAPRNEAVHKQAARKELDPASTGEDPESDIEKDPAPSTGDGEPTQEQGPEPTIGDPEQAVVPEGARHTEETQQDPLKHSQDGSTKSTHEAPDASRATPRPPNILLMMADDLGVGDIGCFGNSTLRTPNIDRLAREGVRLDHDLATAAICTPSRAAFQTGRYPIRMGMVPHNFVRVHLLASNSGGMPNEETTLGEIAKSKGYSTGFIGKWHLGMNCRTQGDYCHHPLNQGYDYFYGLPMSNAKDFGDDGQTLANSRFPRAIPVLVSSTLCAVLMLFVLKRYKFFGLFGFIAWSMLLSVPLMFLLLIRFTGPRMSGMVMQNFDVVEQPIVLPGFTDRLIREGVEFLKARKASDEPFLLVLSWIQVHTALHATRPFKGHSQHGPYGDEVEEMDWSVGEILRALDALDLSRDTLVYFTSDHGGHLEEKGVHGNQEGGWNGIYKGGKGMGGMEGGIRVPTVMRWPGVIPVGSVLRVPTSHLDVFPTVASVLGAELPTDRRIDGVDLTSHLRGVPATSPPHAFLVHYCGDQIHAVRYTPGNGQDVYKAFYATHNFKPGTYECDFVCQCWGKGVTWHDPPIMYNVGRDPSETRPLDISQSETQVVLAEITTRLADHRSSLGPTPEDQFSIGNLLPKPWLQMCCKPPYCKCNEKDHRL